MAAAVAAVHNKGQQCITHLQAAACVGWCRLLRQCRWHPSVLVSNCASDTAAHKYQLML